MKINLNKVLKNGDGTDALNDKKEALTLRFFLKEIILYMEMNKDGQPISPPLKIAWALYELHKKVADEKIEEAQITAEEITLIKERLPKRFVNVLLIGQILELLEEKG